MKKHTYVLFSLFAAISVSAQEVIPIQEYSDSNGRSDFTIGEVIINTGMDDLSQSFHPTNWDFVRAEDFAHNYETHNLKAFKLVNAH